MQGVQSLFSFPLRNCGVRCTKTQTLYFHKDKLGLQKLSKITQKDNVDVDVDGSSA